MLENNAKTRHLRFGGMMNFARVHNELISWIGRDGGGGGGGDDRCDFRRRLAVVVLLAT